MKFKFIMSFGKKIRGVKIWAILDKYFANIFTLNFLDPLCRVKPLSKSSKWNYRAKLDQIISQGFFSLNDTIKVPQQVEIQKKKVWKKSPNYQYLTMKWFLTNFKHNLPIIISYHFVPRDAISNVIPKGQFYYIKYQNIW